MLKSQLAVREWSLIECLVRDPQTHADPMTSPPQCVPGAVAAELPEEVGQRVTRRMHRAPILTISTFEDNSDSDAEIREPSRKRHPLK